LKVKIAFLPIGEVMAEYECATTEEQITWVAAKNRKNAWPNPFAQYQKEVSMEEVLGSPMIVYPIVSYSCCSTGDGGAGTTNIDGRVAMNPSGVLLLSKGHPFGETGVEKVAEIVWQLRGDTKERQVKNPKIGLTRCAGGFQESLELTEVSYYTVLLF
jgi:acetyl-CoA acetyltransferase